VSIALDPPGSLSLDLSSRTAGPAHALVASLLVGAAAIHLAMAPSHLGESAVEGVGFVVAGWVQLGLALGLALRPRRWHLLANIGVNVALIAAWASSRVTGLPFGEHAGHAESVSIVDGACVALEALAVVGAVMLLAGRGGVVARSAAVAAAGSLAAVVLATGAIASPAARDHASGSHGDHGVADSHGHEGVADDLGFAALQNGQMGDHAHPTTGTEAAEPSMDPATAGELAGQLALTAPLVEAYPTLQDATAAGYRQAGPYSPGLGVHFTSPSYTLNADGDMDPEDIANPTLIYDGLAPGSRLAGFMYMAYRETEPPGFAGDLDRWHFHTAVCIVMTPQGIETPFGADLTGVTEQMCADEGGTLLDFTGYMVHVWTVPGYESELGTFSDLNPKLTCPDGSYHVIPISQVGDADSTCKDP
jgi:hypothetical protein